MEPLGGGRVTCTPTAMAFNSLVNLLGQPCACSSSDQATHGPRRPDTVVVMPNQSVPDSLILAERYADARDIPANRICPIDVPNVETISLKYSASGFSSRCKPVYTMGGHL